MIHSVKKRVRQVITLWLIVVAGPVLGGGGDWKMGPFGPYWDDNSWPEFTPMYWMEEFMNRLDDDDDEIQTWMLRNQFPGQSSRMQGVYPQDNWQPDAWTGSRAQSDDGAYTRPYPGVPAGNTYIIGENNPLPNESENDPGPLPYLTPEEFARMPVELQREYKRAFDKEYPIVSKSKPEPETKRRPLPNLTPQEYARMPPELQREYKRAFEREYNGDSRRTPNSERRPLPNLSPQEYARMPAEVQREYRHAFDREYGASSMPSSRQRPRLPRLTPEEYARMPLDLQKQYEREFNREYAEYQARIRDARQRRNVAPSRDSRAGGYP